MSTSLVPIEALGSLTTQVGDDSAYTKYSRSGEFLKRLQFFSKAKTLAGGKKLVPPGNYGIPDGDDVRVLGDSIDVIPLARRPKAIDFTNPKQPIVVHDPQNAEFQRIEAESAVKDSQCMSGVAFLVLERTTGELYEFFCGNAGLKRAAAEIAGYLPVTPGDCAARGLSADSARAPEPCTLGSKFVEKKTWQWHDPTVGRCSTPFVNVPDVEYLAAEITKFVTEKDSDAQVVGAADAPKRAR